MPRWMNYQRVIDSGQSRAHLPNSVMNVTYDGT